MDSSGRLKKYLHFLKYDHLEFPGVVPRTFIAPLFVATLSFPLVFIGHILGISKLIGLYCVRMTIGYSVLVSLEAFKFSAQKHFGEGVTTWFTFIIGTQFHFMFYLSRPLPNIFALIIVLWSYKFWFEQKHENFIATSAGAIIIFRGELAILLGLFLLSDLVKQRITIERAIRMAVPCGVVSLAATVIIDSIFWKRLLWPEGEVLWFNIVENKSSEWGTSPFFWYFYSALPRALGASLLLVLFSVYFDRRAIEFLLPPIGFVLIYSFLGHKELRFIIYVIPLLDLAAAMGCHRLWENRLKGNFQMILAVSAVGHLLANSILSLFLLSVSSTNYPGGFALAKLHSLEHSPKNRSVHIDVFSAQTGISRFSQLNPHWEYNKSENLDVASLQRFEYLLVEGRSKYSTTLKPFIETHEIFAIEEAFNQVHFSYSSFPPLKVRLKPSIFILKNLHRNVPIFKKNRRRKTLENKLKRNEMPDKNERKVKDSLRKRSSQGDNSAKINLKKESLKDQVTRKADLYIESDETENFDTDVFSDLNDEFLNDYVLDSYEVEHEGNPVHYLIHDSLEDIGEWLGNDSDENL
ncbi:dol-P-Man:Man(7)GlcNAc(2)-PP-Dol alpha-1,6-mannosyltransferase-like isoform X2 [Artemia franciscana]|uniref:Mannosyltransferase n=1 Tax=Artemia franciscana TaxID=6661 RepID=A0AA88KZA5_ARTSF|nr:hypothetical protein QYM36_015314 [Artemia franciscana]